MDKGSKAVAGKDATKDTEMPARHSVPANAPDQPSSTTRQKTHKKTPATTEPKHRVWMDVLSSDDEEDERIAAGGKSEGELYWERLKQQPRYWTHEQKVHLCSLLAGNPAGSDGRAKALREADEVFGRDCRHVEARIRRAPGSIYYKILYPAGAEGREDTDDHDAGGNIEDDAENDDAKADDEPSSNARD